MKLVEYIRMALYEIWHNKARTFLTLVGIIIGIGAVIVIVFIVQGAEDFLLAEFKKIAPLDIMIAYGRYDLKTDRLMGSITMDDVRNIREKESRWIRAIAPRYWTGNKLRYRDVEKNCTVIATTPEFMDIYELKIGPGRFLSWTDINDLQQVVVLSSDAAEEIFKFEDPLGKKIQLYDTAFTVIGVLAPEDKSILMPVSLDSDRIFIPITVWERFFKVNNRFTLLIRLKDRSFMQQEISRIKNYFDEKYGLAGDGESKIQVRDIASGVEQLSIIKLVLIILLGGVASITLMVAGIGVMNIMLVIVTERTKQVGLQKALGATNRDILIQFLIESIVLCIVGGALGIVAGYFGSQIVYEFATNYIEVDTALPYWAVFISLAFTTAVGIFFGIYPAWKAARMDPVEALRYE